MKMLKNTDYPEEALQFLNFINSDAMKEVLNKYGFTKN